MSSPQSNLEVGTSCGFARRPSEGWFWMLYVLGTGLVKPVWIGRVVGEMLCDAVLFIRYF